MCNCKLLMKLLIWILKSRIKETEQQQKNGLPDPQ